MAEEEELAIPLVWDGLEEAPILFSNQFLIQHQPGEFVLTMSAVTNPPLLGTEEEKREQFKRLTEYPIKVLGRYALTRRRLVELIELLQDNLEKHDRRAEEQGGTDDRNE